MNRARYFHLSGHIKMILNRIISIYLLFAISTSTGMADENSFIISSEIYSFTYQEYNQTNQLLDKENGLLSGITIGLSQQANDVILESRLSVFGGKIDYTGQTQSGTPHQTKTNEELYNLGFKIITPVQPNLITKLFFSFQYWRWNRDILTVNNVFGLNEIYTWCEIEAGARFELSTNNQSMYWLNISALHTVNPAMKIQLESGSQKVNLGENPGFRILAGKTWPQINRASVSVNLIAEYWSFGRSNTIFVNDFFGSPAFLTEPESETVNIGFGVSYLFQF